MGFSQLCSPTNCEPVLSDIHSLASAKVKVSITSSSNATKKCHQLCVINDRIDNKRMREYSYLCLPMTEQFNL